MVLKTISPGCGVRASRMLFSSFCYSTCCFNIYFSLLLWQTLAKITYALSNVNCEREAQLVMTKVYIALDSGISNPHLTTENAGKAIATQSSTIKPLTEEDIMAEVLSCSPDFHADRRKELAFPPASEDRDNDRLDSGISLKSYNTNTTTSPPLPCYSDYDNIEKKPVSDVVLLQQQNPIMLTRHFYPKERHHHQRYQHLPVIEETEMDCIEPDVDDVKGTDNVVSFSEQDANKRSALKTDSPEVSGKLLRPESSVVMAQVATKDTFDNNNIVYHKDGVNVNTQQRSKMKNEPKNNETVTSLLKQVMQKNLSESKTSSSSLSSEKCACTKMVKWVKVPDDKVKGEYERRRLGGPISNNLIFAIILFVDNYVTIFCHSIAVKCSHISAVQCSTSSAHLFLITSQPLKAWQVLLEPMLSDFTGSWSVWWVAAKLVQARSPEL